MAFTYQRTIHFPDTDAAGVVFFANYLAICHEAYEESVAAAGHDFGRLFSHSGVMIPISKSTADYLRPLFCGDRIAVSVTPSLLSENSFVIDYAIQRLGDTPKLAATTRTWHVCIRTDSRERTALPAALADWIRTASDSVSAPSAGRAGPAG